MIKNLIITLMSVALLIFVLYYIDFFEITTWTGRDERSQHEMKRTEAVRKNSTIVIGSVYSSKDQPAAESVKGAEIAAELLRKQGKDVKYVTSSECHKYPETASEVQKLCADYKVSAILGPGNSETLTSIRALTHFYALPLISPITVRPEKLPALDHDNYVSFFPPLEKWVDAILTHMKDNNIRQILIISPEHGTYGEIFSSVLERKGKDFLDDFKIYRLSYQQALRVNHLRDTIINYNSPQKNKGGTPDTAASYIPTTNSGQHQVDAVFFGGVGSDLPELIELLQMSKMDLPVYVSDDITLKDIPKKAQIRFILPEAEVPVRDQEWQKLFVSRYQTQPSYQAALGAETMFALVENTDLASYTPEAMIRAMDQAAKELNQKIKIKIVEIPASQL